MVHPRARGKGTAYWDICPSYFWPPSIPPRMPHRRRSPTEAMHHPSRIMKTPESDISRPQAFPAIGEEPPDNRRPKTRRRSGVSPADCIRWFF